VVFADWLRGYGLLLIVDHGDGYLSLYGCNESLLKDVGDWVDTNEVVATSGASGGRKTPGLYFELRHDGKPWMRAPGSNLHDPVNRGGTIIIVHVCVTATGSRLC
jgi:septal ring factor EnvC (AmiA/AmiB activator)